MYGKNDLWKDNRSCLGESKKKAMECLNSLCNLLVKESKFCLLYKILCKNIKYGSHGRSGRI